MSYAPGLTVDTDPHPAFPFYSAGNFAEVAPERLSPLSWSLIGEPVERANRRMVQRLWPAATWARGSHYVFVGYFACRPYHNLTAYCHLADQVPLVSRDDVTMSYFEEARLPTGFGSRRGRRLRLAVVPRMLREFFSLQRSATRLEGTVGELERSARAALARNSALALGPLLERARGELVEVWDLHYSTTITLIPLRVLQRNLGQRFVPHWDELEPWLNHPAELVWSSLQEAAGLGGSLHAGEFLDQAFYEVADAQEPWSSIAARRAAGLESSPSPQRPLEDPAEVAFDIHRGARSALLPQVTRAVTGTMALRETTKSLAMRCLHVLRRTVPAIAAAAGIADEDWPYLLVSELASLRPAEAAEIARLRRSECRLALDLQPPDLLSFAADDRGPLPATSAAEGGGRGVSAGTATGVVVTPSAPGSGNGPKVLVCDSADADIQPLLAGVAGVVTARGSLLSHISILTREYGIPAVVGYRGVDALTPGALVRINGGTGDVERVEDAAEAWR